MAVASEQEMVAKVQEMRANLVEAEAQVPMAMADAFRSGNLGVMDTTSATATSRPTRRCGTPSQARTRPRRASRWREPGEIWRDPGRFGRDAGRFRVSQGDSA